MWGSRFLSTRSAKITGFAPNSASPVYKYLLKHPAAYWTGILLSAIVAEEVFVRSTRAFWDSNNSAHLFENVHPNFPEVVPEEEEEDDDSDDEDDE